MNVAENVVAILMLASLAVSCRTAGNGHAGRERIVLWPGARGWHEYGDGLRWEVGLGITLGDDVSPHRQITIRLYNEYEGRETRVRKLVVVEGGYTHPTVEREITSADDIERVSSILRAAAQTDVYRYYRRGEQNVIQGFDEYCRRQHPQADSPEEAEKAWQFFSKKYLRYLKLCGKETDPETIRATAKEMLEIIEAEVAVGWMSP